MKESLLQYVVCPECHGSLELSEPAMFAGDVVTGMLLCNGGHGYAIVAGVPRLMPKGGVDDGQRQTAMVYTDKWKRWPDYGYDGASRRFREKWHISRYGWEDHEGLGMFLAGKRMILDAGTGLGSYLELYATRTKGQVFGVDISESLEEAYRRVGDLPNVHLIQADLNKLPLREKAFDFIISDQVLHHTPNTEAAFKGLVPYMSDEGEIAIYVYRKKGAVREYCDYLMRKHTTKMTAEDCIKFAEAATAFGKAVSELSLEMQRDIYWKVFKCFWNPEMDYQTNVMVNYDWFHPVYAWRHTIGEVFGWFHDAGIKVLHYEDGESGISVRGVKQ